MVISQSLRAATALRGLLASRIVAPTRYLSASASNEGRPGPAEGAPGGGEREEPTPYQGSKARSVQQAQAPGVWPPRSPDSPADPTDAAGNRGRDPELAIRTAGGRASETTAQHYDHPAQDIGKGYAEQLPEMASTAAGRAKDAAAGAARAVKEAVVGKGEGEGEGEGKYDVAARRLRRDIEGLPEEEGGGGGR